MSVKFSVVIPVYNVEGYISKCLDSILAQTYDNYEIIIVDDGSTDKTPKICDEYEEKNDKITVIHKKNEGVSIARNTGIEKASGDYFLFFDGDDFVEPFCMKELAKEVEERKVDTVIYGYYRYENDKVKETCMPKFDKDIYSDNDILKDIFPRFIGVSYDGINGWLRHEEDSLYVENPALWRSMVSVDIIKKNKIKFNPKLKVGEDTLFISEYLTYAKKCYISKRCYYYLVTRETSTIFVYEKNAMGKLEGKHALMEARNELTKDVLKRKGIDITDQWSGTVVMSAVELAFYFSKKIEGIGFFKRFSLYKGYASRKDVKDIIDNYSIQKTKSIMVIPFWLLKFKMYFSLYLGTCFLSLINYEFKRS